MSIDIDQLTEEELVALNHRIIERLKMLDSLNAHRAMMSFNMGARVSFESPSGGRVQGTVVKFNRKTVSVVTGDGRKWNVSPHLLSPVKDAKHDPKFVYASEQSLE